MRENNLSLGQEVIYKDPQKPNDSGQTVFIEDIDRPRGLVTVITPDGENIFTVLPQNLHP